MNIELIERHIKKEAQSVLQRVILFLIYYVTLILIGVLFFCLRHLGNSLYTRHF